MIETFVSVKGLRELGGLSPVNSVREVHRAQPRLLGQGPGAHNALNWQSFGRTGAGVKVGIIDDFMGLSALLGTELPAGVTARCYSSIGVFSPNPAACQTESNHGTAVAEALFDVAPEVQLYIANPASTIDFRHTIDWMTSQGVRVINYSASWLWDGPGDGTSPYADSPLISANAAVAAGAVFVTAAGNEARSTWFGPFRDVDGSGWAEFDESGIDDNYAWLSAGEHVSIQLRWQGSWTAAASDLDLGLYDSNYSLVASSSDYQTGLPGHIPREFLTYTVPVTGWYYIGVKRFSASTPAWIQLQFFSGQPLELFTVAGSIGNPAESANSGVLAVGAAPWYTLDSLEPTSSQGPTPDGRIKPDLVGVDRATSVTLGSFAGTSQASPHVAGLAALVLEAFPSYTPGTVSGYLKNFALPRGPVPNMAWGYGLAFLPTITASSGPTMALSKTNLLMGGVSNGATLVSQTFPQIVHLTQNGSGTVTWTAASTQPWLKVSPSSGTGPADLSIGLVQSPLPVGGVLTGHITFSFAGASNAPGPITVTLRMMMEGASLNPFGVVDTPADHSTGVTGSVPFTGWGLDDVQPVNVSICRVAVAGEATVLDARCGSGVGQVHVGHGVFIEGARPDVQAAFATYPVSSRAGWGFMVLTNMLPNQGNGTFVFNIYLLDVEGHVVLLGTRTLTCANATATTPFGAIDTPGQGAIASGSAYVNFGWALTPQPKSIPIDGSTINVFVDGLPVGPVTYNNFRTDIATLFPGLANSDGAVGFRAIDTTALSNGVHTIAWGVTDSAGVASGIGSRYFTVSNGSTAAVSQSAARAALSDADVSRASPASTPILGRLGWTLDGRWRRYAPDFDGRITVQSEELESDRAADPHSRRTVGRRVPPCR